MRVTVVNRQNLKEEFVRIKECLEPGSYVAVDTEFPGTVKTPEKPDGMSQEEYNYYCMKENVDMTKLIQLGLTVCDNNRKLVGVWEFNFNEFNMYDVGRRNPASICFLMGCGVDFVKNRKEGVSEAEFAEEFMACGLTDLKWVFFHSTYDLGYLIKILRQKHEQDAELPEKLEDFRDQLRKYLGNYVFDVKLMVQVLQEQPDGTFHSNPAGLDKLAQNLGLPRVVGRSHQAGSDSLLTSNCFHKALDLLKRKYIGQLFPERLVLEVWSNKLHGFTSPDELPPPVYIRSGPRLPGSGASSLCTSPS